MSESGDQGRSHAFRSGVLAMLPVLIGIAPFAAVVGLAGTQNGFSVVETTAFTVLAYTGAAQVAALDLIGQGASVAVVLVTAFVMNLRFIVYSASVAPIFVEAGFARRLLGSYLLVDHVVALASTRTKGMSLRDAVAFYFGACLVFWGVWQVCALAGHSPAHCRTPAWSRSRSRYRSWRCWRPNSRTAQGFSLHWWRGGRGDMCRTAGQPGHDAGRRGRHPDRRGTGVAVGRRGVRIVSTGTIWLIIGVTALGGLVLRASFILIPVLPRNLPPRVSLVLDMVPAAAFAALVAPALFLDGDGDGIHAFALISPATVAGPSRCWSPGDSRAWR